MSDRRVYLEVGAATVAAAAGTLPGGGGGSAAGPTLVVGLLLGYGRATTGSVIPPLVGVGGSLVVAGLLLGQAS